MTRAEAMRQFMAACCPCRHCQGKGGRLFEHAEKLGLLRLDEEPSSEAARERVKLGFVAYLGPTSAEMAVQALESDGIRFTKVA